MIETSLRWKGRIGSLRVLSILLWIGIAALLLTYGSRAFRALSGSATAEPTTARELMAGGARPFRHVSLVGDAYYDVGYTETSNGSLVASYYVLIDPNTGEGVVVRGASTSLPAGPVWSVTLSGLIYTSPTELSSAVEADRAFFEQNGVSIDAGFFLAEGEEPMSSVLAMALLLGSAWLGVAAAIPFFFPTVAFGPGPAMISSAAPPQQPPGEGGVRVTGRFQQLKRLHPALEIGRRRQRFTSAVANLAILDDGRLMIYIHHVVRTKLYGVVTVSKHESDWAVFVARNEPWQIDPGTIYGWKDRPAIRFRRQSMSAKPDDVYVIFGHPSEQAALAKDLRAAGFPVGTGAMV